MKDSVIFSTADLQHSRTLIGSKIKEIREKNALSQEQLAKSMNISRTTISKIESGKFNCSIDYLTKFALTLNFKIELVEVSSK